MAQYNELPVYKATYDLLLAIFQFTKEFSKEYKYTVGESLKKETIELLTLIYRANTRHQKADVLRLALQNVVIYGKNFFIVALAGGWMWNFKEIHQLVDEHEHAPVARINHEFGKNF